MFPHLNDSSSLPIHKFMFVLPLKGQEQLRGRITFSSCVEELLKYRTSISLLPLLVTVSFPKAFTVLQSFSVKVSHKDNSFYLVLWFFHRTKLLISFINSFLSFAVATQLERSLHFNMIIPFLYNLIPRFMIHLFHFKHSGVLREKMNRKRRLHIWRFQTYRPIEGLRNQEQWSSNVFEIMEK